MVKGVKKKLLVTGFVLDIAKSRKKGSDHHLTSGGGDGSKLELLSRDVGDFVDDSC